MDEATLNELNQYFDDNVKSILDEISEVADKFGLSVSYAEDYNFGRRKWVAVYIGNSVFEGDIKIGVNKKILFDWLVNNCRYDTYDEEMYIQLGVSVYHEFGHAIIDYMQDILYSSEEGDAIYKRNLKLFNTVFFCGQAKEERVVEEYGRYGMSDYTGQHTSILADALGIYLEEIEQLEQTFDKEQTI